MTQIALSPPEGTSVLVITNERDFAADLVIKQIQNLGGRVERWNTESPPAVHWSPDAPPTISGNSAVWLRQHLPEPTQTASVEAVDDFLVVREQWRTWLTELAESDARWMNPLWASRRAENKLVQLRTATSLGLQVPPTIVTNSKAAAEKHQTAVGRCVVKSVSAAYFPFSTSAFMFTRPLDEALDLPETDWDQQPVIVQKMVEPRTDVRLFVVGSHSSAASTTAHGSDWRVHSSDSIWTEYNLPSETIERCRVFSASLGLAYGAFDFAFDGTTHWFLECNQAGEFAFLDRPLDLGVTAAIAAWLTGQHP